MQSSTCWAISGSENHPHTPKWRQCSPHKTGAGKSELHSAGSCSPLGCLAVPAWMHRCQHKHSSFSPAMRDVRQLSPMTLREHSSSVLAKERKSKHHLLIKKRLQEGNPRRLVATQNSARRKTAQTHAAQGEII